ncbi:kinetochore-associated protein 1-like [Oratosquilla oratoria]|uniref:kinetochore-associated protein 1-like n=1 Tax=Oratosquilla oratoria TaxID=337810 RepID=UPI003F771F65
MVVWEVLDANSDDETRQATDAGALTSLYEVVKLAYLEPKQPYRSPLICANGAWGHVAVAIDKWLFVFGEGCSTLHMQLELSCVVDVLIWMPEAAFLVAATRSGEFHCIHIGSKRILLTKELVDKNDDSPTFVSGQCTQWEGVVSIILVATGGQVIQLNNIDPEGICESIKCCNLEQLKILEAQIEFDVAFIDLEGAKIKAAECILDGPKQRMVWVVDSQDRLMKWCSSGQWTEHSVQNMLSPSLDIKKVITLFSGRYIVMLSGKGKLTIVSGITGLDLWTSSKDSPILDFEALPGEETMAQILILVDKSEGGQELQIFDLHEMKVAYQLQVSPETHLVRLLEGMESILLLEPELDIQGCICNMKLKAIVDGLPENRLTKLLNKKKFQEAMEFCKQFGLEVEDVYKAQALYVCDLINPWRMTSGNVTSIDVQFKEEEPIEELLKILSQIKDVEFVTRLCVEAPLPDIPTTKRILNYAKERLGSADLSVEGQGFNNLLQILSENLYRLRTFEILFPSSEIQHWLIFAQRDMLEEFMEYISQGHLNLASTVWHRHQYEFNSRVTESCVASILNAIPLVKASVLCSWLPHNVLADLVKFCPDAIETIAQWADERVKILEVREKSGWPSNGLQLANTVIKELESVAADFQSGGDIEVQMAVHVAQWKAHSQSSMLYHLRQTALALQDLQLLATKFRVMISFSKYTQLNKQYVVDALLDWLFSGDEVKGLLEGFLRSFMLRHKLSIDQSLAHYIKYTLESSSQEWWDNVGATWEDKAYAVIKLISDTQVKAQCILDCLCCAPVPWSEKTKEMYELGITLDTPLTSALEDQCRIVGLKLVMRRYSLIQWNINDPVSAEAILRNIVMQEGDDVLKDSLQVVEAYKHLSVVDAYYFRSLHFIKKGKPEEIASLLQGVTCDLQPVIAKRLLQHNRCVVNKPAHRTKEKEFTRAFTLGGVTLEYCLKQHVTSEDAEEVKKFFVDLRNYSSLQEMFDIYAGLHNLQDEQFCLKILDDYINAWLASTKGSDCAGPGSPIVSPNDEHFKGLAKIKRLANLLNLPPPLVNANLGVQSAKAHRIAETIHFCSELTEGSSASDTSNIYRIISLIIEIWRASMSQGDTTIEKIKESKTNSDFLSVINHLVSSAQIDAHPGVLPGLLELGLWCNIGQTLYLKCFLKGYQSNTHDPLEKWKLSPLFQDVSMPIEEKIVTTAIIKALEETMKKRGLLSNLPYFQKYNQEALASHEEEDDMSNISLELIGHLQERSQDLGSLELSLLMAHRKFREFGVSYRPGMHLILTILLRALSTKQPDLAMSCSLLSLLTKSEALKTMHEVIKRFGYDYHRLHSLAQVGLEYSRVYNLNDITLQFKILQKRASWGKRLAEIDVSFKEAFRGDTVALVQVLSSLVASPKCDFTILNDFCTDFEKEVTSTYLLYLETVMKSWEPQVNEDGLIKEPPQGLIAKCKAIMNYIDEKGRLYEFLRAQLETLDSYNYELIELVLYEIDELEEDPQGNEMTKRGLNILQFLKVYVRRKKPQEMEIDEWMKANPYKSSLPVTSHYRLPFHELFKRTKSMMKIIEPELDLSCIDTWLHVATIIKLNTDELRLTATQNTMTRILAQEESKRGNTKGGSGKVQTWQLYNSNTNLLKMVKETVTKMNHQELATACANWVVNQLPPGADRVSAAKECKILAKNWLEISGTKKGEEAYNRMAARHQQLALEHALHKYGFAEDKYLCLTKIPLNLVLALYEHPCLDSLASLSTQSMPDIHSCVTEICSVVGLNQTAIQLDLLEKWLPPADSCTSMSEETVTNFQLLLDPGASSRDSAEDSSLSRVIYLLRCCSKKEAVSYLLTCALTEDSSISASHRLRALTCLLAIADEDTIFENSGKSIASIRSLLQTVTYVSRLEGLNYTISMGQFDDMDKNALVQGLWRSHKHHPQALILLTDLCHDFKVTIPSLWGAVLTQLTNFVKTGALDLSTMEHVLLQAKGLPELWVIPSLTTAWTTLIKLPFSKASHPVSEANLTSCMHSVDLLLRHCPVAIQTTSLLQLCSSLHLGTLALAIAAADHTHSHDLQGLIDAYPHAQLKAQYERIKTRMTFPRNAQDLLDLL